MGTRPQAETGSQEDSHREVTGRKGNDRASLGPAGPVAKPGQVWAGFGLRELWRLTEAVS